jgi:hypothetical protein
MIERRLLEHWQSERAARAQLRESLPASWRNDPRAKMNDVREVYIEAMLSLSRSPNGPVAIAEDDR